MKKGILFGLIIFFITTVTFIPSYINKEDHQITVCEQDVEWEYF